LATDHLQKTVFYYVDVVRLLYPAWSPDSGVFPFSASDAVSHTSYASNIDASVRGMLIDDVSGDDKQVLRVEEWIGNTSAFLRVIDDATSRVHLLLTSDLFQLTTR